MNDDTRTQLEAERRIIDGATAGPWHWTEYRVPDLVGRGGLPGEGYAYDTEVIEATHNGECGCRSACELELEVSPADREFIAHARTALPLRNAQIEAVLAEHYDIGDGINDGFCEGCEDPYPCRTVLAIEEAGA